MNCRFSRRAVALMLCMLLLFSLTGCNSLDYKKAVSLYDAGRFEEAVTAFEALGEYKDAQQLLKACNYQLGLSRADACDYQGAAEKFLLAGDYEDAAALYDTYFHVLYPEQVVESIKSTLVENGVNAEASLNAEAPNMYDISVDGYNIGAITFRHQDEEGNISDEGLLNYAVLMVGFTGGDASQVDEETMESIFLVYYAISSSTIAAIDGISLDDAMNVMYEQITNISGANDFKNFTPVGSWTYTYGSLYQDNYFYLILSVAPAAEETADAAAETVTGSEADATPAQGE